MLHLVYPYAPGVIAAPWSIGNHLGAGLRAAGHRVRQHDWTDTSAIRPHRGDILIGHPHPSPGYTFRNSCHRDRSWSRVIAMTPWGGLDLTVTMIDGIATECDHLVIICGPYWGRKVPVHWPDWTRVDMAIDQADYPRVVRGFSPPGQRRFLYVGCCTKPKGTDWLQEVASLSRQPITHVGPGLIGTPVLDVGPVDFRNPDALGYVAQHDFILGPGGNDANPTSLLEGLSWGLHPLARPTCGWEFPEPLPADPADAARELVRWQAMPTDELQARHEALRPELDRFTWDRFIGTILALL